MRTVLTIFLTESHYLLPVIAIVTATTDVILQSSSCAIDGFAYIMILKNMLPGAFTCARVAADRDRLKQSGRDGPIRIGAEP